MAHAHNIDEERAADRHARDYFSTNLDGRQTRADNVITNGSACCKWTHIELVCPSSINVYKLCMAKRSCLIKWLVEGDSCSEKEGRQRKMKV
ncbi:hypothetical protein TNCV_3601211 [Trichonephila clavipes]|nr:hypothetical protein TNCV_3601211 [Trichonephila clavipes]